MADFWFRIERFDADVLLQVGLPCHPEILLAAGPDSDKKIPDEPVFKMSGRWFTTRGNRILLRLLKDRPRAVLLLALKLAKENLDVYDGLVAAGSLLDLELDTNGRFTVVEGWWLLVKEKYPDLNKKLREIDPLVWTKDNP